MYVCIIKYSKREQTECKVIKKSCLLSVCGKRTRKQEDRVDEILNPTHGTLTMLYQNTRRQTEQKYPTSNTTNANGQCIGICDVD